MPLPNRPAALSPSTAVSRRDFLGCAGAALLGCAALPSSAAEGKPAYQLGCFTRPWDKHDWRVAFDAIAEAGFSHAGIMTTNTKQWVMLRADMALAEAELIRKEARQRKLSLLSAYGTFSVSESPKAGADELRRLIDCCAAAGCPSLLLGGTTDPKQHEPYYQAIGQCCDYAAERHVSLTIKPHGGTNATGPQCRKVIEKVGHPNFSLWYDPGNIFYYSDGKLDPVEDAPMVNGIVRGMYVKDFLPPKEVLVTPGTGRVNFPKVLGSLRQGGFKSGPLVIECLKPGELAQVTAAAREARLYMEKVLAGLMA